MDEGELMDASSLPDTSHTEVETRLNPGVYPSDPQGHTILVGDNQRSLTVVDLGGVIQVGGVDVTNPDHLDQLADRIRQRANRMRERATT
jgi:hypothetical protein